MIITNNFHKKGFALGLVLKQRLAASLGNGLLAQRGFSCGENPLNRECKRKTEKIGLSRLHSL